MPRETPKTIYVSEEQRLALLGLMTLLIGKRRELQRMEDTARRFLVEAGAREGQYRDVESAISEGVYNEGDDPEKATESVCRWLGLEVGEDA